MTGLVSRMAKTKVEVGLEGQVNFETCPTLNEFQRWAGAVLGDRPGPFGLAVRIVDENEMRQFNARYRERDYATNVLSFPADLPDGLPEEIRCSQLGDLLICAPVVAREAAQGKLAEKDHWAHLTIHGILHLLGYDHEQDDDANVMEALETRILATLGITDPYQQRDE